MQSKKLVQLSLEGTWSVDGFSVLNPRSALNPGTILLTYMEIVSKLKVDLKKQIFYFLKKPQKSGRKHCNAKAKNYHM